MNFISKIIEKHKERQVEKIIKATHEAWEAYDKAKTWKKIHFENVLINRLTNQKNYNVMNTVEIINN